MFIKPSNKQVLWNVCFPWILSDTIELLGKYEIFWTACICHFKSNSMKYFHLFHVFLLIRCFREKLFHFAFEKCFKFVSFRNLAWIECLLYCMLLQMKNYEWSMIYEQLYRHFTLSPMVTLPGKSFPNLEKVYFHPLLTAK